MSDSESSSESTDVEELYVGEKLGRESVQDEEKEKPPRDLIHVIFPKSLSKEQAANCLSRIGKPVNCSGLQLAYLMLKANDMKLTNVNVISEFPHLMFVDVSGNYLQKEDLYILNKIEYLLMLKADDNRFDSCKLPKFPYLQVLTFNKNKITQIEGIDHPKLLCLELNYNKLTEAIGLNPFRLRDLKHLELRGNSLTSTIGIYCQNLEVLILCENLIEKIVGLEILKKLRVLHLRDNPLSHLNGFSESMESLTYLNLRSCQISSLKEVEKLKILPKLDTLILWDNPIVDSLRNNYRLHVLNILPNLKRIDKGVIHQDDIHFADLLKKRMEMKGEYEGEDFGEYSPSKSIAEDDDDDDDESDTD